MPTSAPPGEGGRRIYHLSQVGSTAQTPPSSAPAELQGGRGLAPVQPDIVEGGSLSNSGAAFASGAAEIVDPTARNDPESQSSPRPRKAASWSPTGPRWASPGMAETAEPNLGRAAVGWAACESPGPLSTAQSPPTPPRGRLG